MGSNYALSEMAAAILLDRLPTLDSELDLRDANARYLSQQLGEVPGLWPLPIPPQQDRVSVFEYAVGRTPDSFAGRSTGQVCWAVGRELGLNVYLTDPPLDRNGRYCPHTKATWRHTAFGGPSGEFPTAHRLHANLILVHHPALLADSRAMDDIVSAFAKVSEHADELPKEDELHLGSAG